MENTDPNTKTDMEVDGKVEEGKADMATDVGGEDEFEYYDEEDDDNLTEE